MKKYYLTKEIIQEIRDNAKSSDFESRNGYVIMHVSFKKNDEKHYLPIKLLEGLVVNNKFVGHFEPGFRYHEEGKNWKIIPYHFNEENNNMRSVRDTLLVNHGNSLGTVDKFLMVNPEDIVLYLFSTEDWINKTFPRNISDSIEIKNLNLLSQDEKQIISEERKKLDELTLQFHKFLIKTANVQREFEKRLQNVKDYNPKLLTRGYLLYKFYE